MSMRIRLVDAVTGAVTWLQGHGGAALVSDHGFLISDYSGQPVTMDGTIKTFAVPTGARKIRVYNAGPSTETVLVAPGASQQDAEDALNFDTDHATTGYFVPPVADAGGAAVAELGLAAGTTHVAICNALTGDTPLIYVSFGG